MKFVPRNKNKIAVILAAVGVAISGATLSGCALPSGATVNADGSINGAGQTLNVLYAANSLYPTEQVKWFADIDKKFYAQTGAHVKFETFVSANDELTKIQTSVISGQGPDIYSLGTTFNPTAFATGAFVKMTPKNWAKIGGREQFTPASLGISGPRPGDEIGIPMQSRPFVMAYNTELLAKAGIAKPADTWDGLRQQAKQLTKDGVYGLSVAYADNFDPWKFIWAMSAQAGNPLVKGKKLTLNAPPTVTAYQTMFDWLTKDKVVDPAAVGWKNSQALANFASGKSAFMPMTSAVSINTLESSPVKGKYAYALMPTVPPGATVRPQGGVNAASILSGSNVVVANYSRNQDLSFELIKLLSSAKEQRIYYDTFGELPTNAAAAKALAAERPALKPMIEASNLSVATPFTGAWSDIQLGLTNVVVQSIPKLNDKSISSADITSLLAKEQTTAQAALDRTR